MKDIILGIICWILLSSLAFFALIVGSNSANEKAEKVLNNSIENMENLKRDCEKLLPREKVCVMVFDYIPLDADYE